MASPTIEDVVVVDVHLDHAAVPGALSCDHVPYVIDLCTDDVLVMRVHRSLHHILMMHEALKQNGLEVGGVPERKRFHFAGMFGANFNQSEEGIKRRRTMAHYLNKVWKRSAADVVLRNIVLQWLDGARAKPHLASVQRTRKGLERWTAITAVEAALYSVSLPEGGALLHPNDWVEYATGRSAVAVVSARSGEEDSDEVIKLLVEGGGDVHMPCLKGHTPLEYALMSIARHRTTTQETGEDSQQSAEKDCEVTAPSTDIGDIRFETRAFRCIQVLLESGADPAEVNVDGHYTQHLGARNSAVVGLLCKMSPRLFTVIDESGKTAADIALGVPECSALLYACAAPHAKEVAEIEAIVERETAQLDGFLQLARANNEYSTQVKIITQMADMRLVNEPLVAARIYAAAVAVARAQEGLDEEVQTLLSKIKEVQDRICSIYMVDPKACESFEFVELLKSRNRQLRDLRANHQSLGRFQSIREQQVYLSEKLEALLKDLWNDAVSSVEQPPPCDYAVVLLGAVAHMEAVPGTTVEYGILVERDSFWILEYFRMLSLLFETRVIALQETEYKIFDHNTHSPIPPNGLCIDQLGCVPFRPGKKVPFTLVCTPSHAASAQEDGMCALGSHDATLLLSSRLLCGSATLFASYQQQMNMVLGRRQDTSAIELRQTRAQSFISSALAAFEHNYSPEDEDTRLVSLKAMVEMPQVALRGIALFFKVPQSCSVWSIADELVARGHISDGVAADVKRALTSLLSVCMRADAQSVVKLPDREAGEVAGAGKSEDAVVDVEGADEVSVAAVDAEGSGDSNISIADGDIREGVAEAAVEDGGSSAEDPDGLDATAGAKGSSSPRESAGSSSEMRSLLTSDEPDGQENEDDADDADGHVPSEGGLDDQAAMATFLLDESDEEDEFTRAMAKHDVIEDELEVQSEDTPAKQQSEDAGPRNYYTLTEADIHDIVEALKVLVPLSKVLRELKDFTVEHPVLLQEGLYEDSHLVCAEAYTRLSMHDQALSEYMAAAEASPEDSELLNVTGMMLFKAGEFERAIIYYRRAVDLKVGVGERSTKMAAVYMNLAMAHMQAGEEEEAVACMQKALEVDLELFGDTHKHVAHDYRYLGRLNKRLGRYDEALEALSKARDIERKLAPGPTVRLAACIGDLGALHYEMGHFEEAAALHEEALAMEKRLVGARSDEVAVRHSTVAECYVRLRVREKAYEHFQVCRRIVLRLFGVQHPRHAASLFNLGVVAFQMERLEESKGYLRKSLAIYRAIASSENNSSVRDVMKVLAMVEEALKHRELGLEEYERWKAMLAEERRRREKDLSSKTMWRLQSEKVEEEEPMAAPVPSIVAPSKIFSSGKIGKGQMDVLDDDFFDL